MSGKRIKEHKSEMVHDWSSKWFSKCESLMDMTLLVIGNHLSRLLYCLLCGCVVECLSCLFFFFLKVREKSGQFTQSMLATIKTALPPKSIFEVPLNDAVRLEVILLSAYFLMPFFSSTRPKKNHNLFLGASLFSISQFAIATPIDAERERRQRRAAHQTKRVFLREASSQPGRAHSAHGRHQAQQRAANGRALSAGSRHRHCAGTCN